MYNLSSLLALIALFFSVIDTVPDGRREALALSIACGSISVVLVFVFWRQVPGGNHLSNLATLALAGLAIYLSASRLW